jgi:hypothetical protein
MSQRRINALRELVARGATKGERDATQAALDVHLGKQSQPTPKPTTASTSYLSARAQGFDEGRAGAGVIDPSDYEIYDCETGQWYPAHWHESKPGTCCIAAFAREIDPSRSGSVLIINVPIERRRPGHCFDMSCLPELRK